MTAESILETVKKFTDVPEVLDFYHAVATAAEKLVLAAMAEERAAERERCAKVAETWASWMERTGYDSEEHAAEDIAAKIRTGK